MRGREGGRGIRTRELRGGLVRRVVVWVALLSVVRVLLLLKEKEREKLHVGASWR